MKRVAVFGNAGGGKSTLARQLSIRTGLPLHALDRICYTANGDPVPQEAYAQKHAELLAGECWIIEGYGCATTLWQRLSAADTLVYIDLPLWTHYLWVTRRLLKGLFVNPEGWPANSSIWKGSLGSYRVIGLCDRQLTPKYRAHIAAVSHLKRVHHLKAPAEMKAFLQRIERKR
jgi:adenylate kinase family enzyme